MFIVNCQVYPFEILVYYEKNKKQLIKYLQTILPANTIKELNKLTLSRGKSIMFSSGQTLLWLERKPKTVFDLAVLSHEIFHCACFILARVGIKYSKKSDEAFAYLIQYISNEIYKNLGITFS